MIQPGATVIASAPYSSDTNGNETWAFMFLMPEAPYYAIMLPDNTELDRYFNIASAGEAWADYTGGE